MKNDLKKRRIKIRAHIETRTHTRIVTKSLGRTEKKRKSIISERELGKELVRNVGNGGKRVIIVFECSEGKGNSI